ncbi:MAG TPA: c-type cytochrome, partial [Ramlibacter sp.]|nr:c-type cytochrome [Ramlibacter sp.]
MNWIRRCASAALAALLYVGCLPAMAEGPADSAQTVIHMLDYVSVDYPQFVRDGKVLDEPEYQEQLEFARQSLALLQRLPDAADKPALVAKAGQLVGRIEAKAPGGEVAALARSVGAETIRIYQVAVAPRQPPDLQRAAALFQAQCIACHGAQGRGDGPSAKGMDPAPSNFHDAARMQQRSVYGLYNTITLGVGGTGMRGFAELEEADRWALAFLVAGLRTPPEAVRAGQALWQQGVGKQDLASLRALVTSTPEALAAQGNGELAQVQAFLVARPATL